MLKCVVGQVELNQMLSQLLEQARVLAFEDDAANIEFEVLTFQAKRFYLLVSAIFERIRFDFADAS